MQVVYSVPNAAAVVAALARRSDRAAEKALVSAGRAGALVVEAEWKREFRKKSDPSVPGLAPRVQTGTYRRAIHSEVRSSSRTRVVYVVGPGVIDPPYPAFLEWGTAKMPPHPIARPAWDRSKQLALDESTRVLAAIVLAP